MGGPPEVQFQELGEVSPMPTLTRSFPPSPPLPPSLPHPHLPPPRYGLFLKSLGCRPKGNKTNRIFISYFLVKANQICTLKGSGSFPAPTQFSLLFKTLFKLLFKLLLISYRVMDDHRQKSLLSTTSSQTLVSQGSTGSLAKAPRKGPIPQPVSTALSWLAKVRAQQPRAQA